MKKYLFLLLLIASTVRIYSCSCPPPKNLSEAQKRAQKSEFIFVGEILEINNENNTFVVKVIESFKPSIKKQEIIIGKNYKYCFPVINKKGKWMIYGHKENGFLYLNMCGISRSFNKPEKGYYVDEWHFKSINKPRIDLNDKNAVVKRITENEKEYLEFQKKAKIDLQNEIKILRMNISK